MTTCFSVNAKMHPQLISCMVATLILHLQIMKIHKNRPGDRPNDFSKFHGDWMYGF